MARRRDLCVGVCVCLCVGPVSTHMEKDYSGKRHKGVEVEYCEEEGYSYFQPCPQEYMVKCRKIE